jgi:CHAD domain-containing protein
MPLARERSSGRTPERTRRRASQLQLSPAEGARTAARRVLDRQLTGLESHEARARAGDVDGIHEFRVATRRLRALLRLFQPVLPAVEAARLRVSLGWVAHGVGAVRDLDVLGQAIAVRARRLEPELRRALLPVRREIRTRRARAHAELLTLLKSPRYAAVRRRLARLLRRPGPVHPLSSDSIRASRTGIASQPPRRGEPALGSVAGDLLVPAWARVVRAGGRLRPGADAAAYHRLRVLVKRLRYALEALSSLPGAHTRRAIEDLERLQDRLGALQDSETQRAWLRAYAKVARVPPATLVATGAMMQLLARRTGRSRARADRAWRRFQHRQGDGRVLESFAVRDTPASPAPRTVRTVRGRTSAHTNERRLPRRTSRRAAAARRRSAS